MQQFGFLMHKDVRTADDGVLLNCTVWLAECQPNFEFPENTRFP